MNKISKFIHKILPLVIAVVNFIYAKAVHATVIYASPDRFSPDELGGDTLNSFLKNYLGVVVFILLLALVGLITLVRMIIIKIFRKK